MCPDNILGLKIFKSDWSEHFFESATETYKVRKFWIREKNRVNKKSGSTKMLVLKNLDLTLFGVWKFVDPNKFGSGKILCLKKLLVRKKFGSEKYLSK